MLPSLAPTGYKNGGDNERSFLVDKQAVDVGAVKGFYFFIFEPELVVVSNTKQGNGAEHGLLHSVGTKKKCQQGSVAGLRVCLVLVWLTKI